MDAVSNFRARCQQVIEEFEWKNMSMMDALRMEVDEELMNDRKKHELLLQTRKGMVGENYIYGLHVNLNYTSASEEAHVERMREETEKYVLAIEEAKIELALFYEEFAKPHAARQEAGLLKFKSPHAKQPSLSSASRSANNVVGDSSADDVFLPYEIDQDMYKVS